jgi:hypothetical protein
MEMSRRQIDDAKLLHWLDHDPAELERFLDSDPTATDRLEALVATPSGLHTQLEWLTEPDAEFEERLVSRLSESATTSMLLLDLLGLGLTTAKLLALPLEREGDA